MINVLIVDDEEIVRLGLKALANWEEYGFSFRYEAANGRQALEILNRHDDIGIAIIDMQMPRMNGLELMREIERLNYSVKPIVLSAFDEYALVRSAFKLGAVDYISKTEMNFNEILAQLRSAAEKMRADGTKARFENTEYREQIAEKSIKDLLLNINTHSAAAEKDWFDISAKLFSVCSVSVENGGGAGKAQLIKDMLGGLEAGTQARCVVISPSEFCIVFAFAGKSRQEALRKCRRILRKLSSQSADYLNLNLTIGVSDFGKSPSSFPGLYNQAVQNAKLKFILGRGAIVFPEDARKIKSVDIGDISGHNARFAAALKSGEKSGITAALDEALDVINSYNPLLVEKIFPYYTELLFSLTQYIHQTGESPGQIFGADINLYEQMRRFDTREALNAWIRDITARSADYFSKKDARLNRAVVMAMNFIKQNYQDKELSLKTVSRYVLLSENHLSSLFTRQLGMSFTEYLTEVRIRKAEALLRETGLKIYEVADSVGFSNTEYFSKTFKKIAGHSPKSYS